MSRVRRRIVRSFGWYPIRAIDFTRRARCLPTLLTQDDPEYPRKMLARLARMYVDVRWPTTGLHRYRVGADFEFATVPIGGGGVRFLFGCSVCREAGIKQWRTQVRFIHPTEESSWCGRCLFGTHDGADGSRPCGLDLDYQAEKLAGIAAYRMEEIRDAFVDLKNRYAPFVGAPERSA